MLPAIYLVPLFLCWGSFLNFLAYRLVHDRPFATLKSSCPKCNNPIAWYDLIPVLSWLALKAKCRSCHKPISTLYPIIELITLAIGIGLIYLIPVQYFLAYFIFSSALIITIRTDLETMLISRFTTTLLIPVAFAFSLTYYGHNPLLPLNIADSVFGAAFGFFMLFAINKLFALVAKKDGMGQGDIDLLACIGAFTGIKGAWVSLMIGSILGSIIGLILIFTKSNKLSTKIPFGPFLAIGALVYILLQSHLIRIFFC